MCLRKLANWLGFTHPQNATSNAVMSKAAPVPVAPTIPYPEEAPDYTRTIENTSIEGIMLDWLRKYQIPLKHWDYWRTKIDIKVFNYWTDDIVAKFPTIKADTPAFTYEENDVRHLYCRAAFLNPGVLAHEQAHSSFALLSDWQRVMFTAEYNPLKTTDPLIVLLCSKSNCGLTGDVESHAEIFRYLGPDKMPLVLRKYYPRLIGG